MTDEARAGSVELLRRGEHDARRIDPPNQRERFLMAGEPGPVIVLGDGGGKRADLSADADDGPLPFPPEGEARDAGGGNDDRDGCAKTRTPERKREDEDGEGRGEEEDHSAGRVGPATSQRRDGFVYLIAISCRQRSDRQVMQCPPAV